MGRPREHGAGRRDELLDAAEQLIAEGGPDALSVRAAADAVGTTTRAVYSVFGSKDGLLAALAERVFDLLADKLEEVPETDDPAHDLIDAATRVFRAMAIDNPAAYRITFLRIVPELDLGAATRESADHAMGLLRRRFERLADAGRLDGRTAAEATGQFHALCEGLATIELRSPAMLGDDPEHTWRRAVATLLSGLAAPVLPEPRRRPRRVGRRSPVER